MRRGSIPHLARLLAGVAVVVLVAVVASRFVGMRSRVDERPELRELVAALDGMPTRLNEARWTGGFAYKRPPTPVRGGGVALSPDAKIAAALIEKRARTSPVAANMAALGTAYVALGEWNRAVDALEEAVESAPDVAAYQSDLSAAYLARASALGTAEDLSRALAAATRALARANRLPEAHFNRSLALRRLALNVQERAARAAHLAVEPAGPWAEESIDRLRELRAHDAGPQAAGDAKDHQATRERIEDRLLGEWGVAIEAGDGAAASRALGQASELADRLAADGGDAMARDEIALIRRAQRESRAMLLDLARGHRLYAAAQERWNANELTRANELMTLAADHLRRAGSPYWRWSAVFRAVLLQTRGDAEAAVRLLTSVPMPDASRRYLHLRGRFAWIEGYLWASQGRFDRARSRFRDAVDEFTAASETDSLVATHTNLAESEWYLGDSRSAWSNLASALTLANAHGTTSRIEHLDVGARFALDAELPETALEFHDALIRAVASPGLRAEAHLRRARNLVRLARPAEAMDDLALAERALADFREPALGERIRAEISVARAEAMADRDCADTIAASERALPYFERTRMIWLGSLLTIRGRCYEAMGNRDAAHDELQAAVEVFEGRRTLITSSADRVQSFELERRAFNELLELEVLRRKDADAGLRTAERARAGVLAEAWQSDGAAIGDHRELPPGVAVVYYESLDEHVLVWVLTREGRELFSRALPDATLRRSVSRMRRAIEQGASVAALRPYSAVIYDELVAPALAIANRHATASGVDHVVFVPDGALFAVPFAALPDERLQPLLEKVTVSVAPSLRMLLAASQRLAGFSPAHVLAVGDGHDPRASGLPRLPRADHEAAEVGKLYPRSTVLTGAAATRQRFIDARAGVIHFAGHSVVNGQYPAFSRMLLAPDASRADPGWLLGSDVTRARFGTTDVVVLATCEGATGRAVDGEGAISLARAFVAAGVPAVVASLWPVEDDVQALTVTLHRSLIADRDPARALRAGQLALRREKGVDAPVRVWGGFIMLGGLTPPG